MQTVWVNKEWLGVKDIFNELVREIKEIGKSSPEQFDITVVDSENGYTLSLWGYKLELSCRIIVKDQTPLGLFECKLADETIFSFIFEGHYGEVISDNSQDGIQFNCDLRQKNANHKVLKAISQSLIKLIRI